MAIAFLKVPRVLPSGEVVLGADLRLGRTRLSLAAQVSPATVEWAKRALRDGGARSLAWLSRYVQLDDAWSAIDPVAELARIVADDFSSVARPLVVNAEVRAATEIYRLAMQGNAEATEIVRQGAENLVMQGVMLASELSQSPNLATVLDTLEALANGGDKGSAILAEAIAARLGASDSVSGFPLVVGYNLDQTVISEPDEVVSGLASYARHLSRYSLVPRTKHGGRELASALSASLGDPLGGLGRRGGQYDEQTNFRRSI